MDRLTTEHLSTLATTSGESLLSLYMPTQRAGREVQQNRIRFKNLIDDARKALERNYAEGEHLWMGSNEGNLPQEEAAEDLINAAVVATLTNGGEVLSASPEPLGAKPLAAIMQFPLKASQLEETTT